MTRCCSVGAGGCGGASTITTRLRTATARRARGGISRTDPETPLTVAIDDTLLQRWGRRVWGCFYHHDATANSDRSAVAWGNNWVVVGIVVRIAILDRSQSRVKVIRGDMARALIIVDFQNDFTPGGALPVPDGDQIS